MNNTIQFIDSLGSFTVSLNQVSYLYFPLTNGYQLKSSITPQLNGSLLTDQNHFALLPVSQEDLQNSVFGRHFWLDIQNYGLFNVSGVSSRQKYENEDQVEVTAGFLYHSMKRINKKAAVECTATTFAPHMDANIEMTKITIRNTSDKICQFTPTVAIPLFSRSADNLRDHRHVSALLNRALVVKNGIVNQPTLSFDERGHQVNDVVYGVFVSDEVSAYNPKLQEFIGEGGSLDWPKSLMNPKIGNYSEGETVEGFEVIGAMQLKSCQLNPQEEKSYVFLITIGEPNASQFCTVEIFDRLFAESKTYWQQQLSQLKIETSDENFNQWTKWVALQPILRRLFGCSFLPHHDYGRGGRGWRDLWQDCLALLLTEPSQVDYLLYNNFAGIRLDGTNATIIGSKPGEFLADRNHIVRVWMDHGVWPWNTTKLYLDRTGDYAFLFKKQTYFKDSHVHYARLIDKDWDESQGNQHRTPHSVYEGTILEHLLLQNLVPFFNVGPHNHMRLEGADWNDGLDMAKEFGESVAFTSFYYLNYKQLVDLMMHLQSIGHETIEVFKEILPLIEDTISYESIEEKTNLLITYFSSVEHLVSGQFVKIPIKHVILSFERKIEWLKNHLQKTEWLPLNQEEGLFNGYYDNHQKPLEGLFNTRLRMTLTGQVFPIMSGIASLNQAKMILNAAKHYLYDKNVGGYRLNTPFDELKLDMGRLFGFAYGHKENGAMFSHMAMMFAYGLYEQNLSLEAFTILDEISHQSLDFDRAKIYPGLPEYFDSDGRGMYHYLTGSASWFILIVVAKMFGIEGKNGDLFLNPKLILKQFDANNTCSITTLFQNKRLTIRYYNLNQLEVNTYQVKQIIFDEVPYSFTKPIIENSLLRDGQTIKVYLE